MGFGRRQVTLIAQAKVQSQARQNAIVVADEEGEVLRRGGLLRVDVEAAGRRETKLHRSKLLTDRARRRVVVWPVGPALAAVQAELVEARRIAVAERVLLQQPQVAAELQAVLAHDVAHHGEDLETVERNVVALAVSEVRVLGTARHGEAADGGGGNQRRRKAER